MLPNRRKETTRISGGSYWRNAEQPEEEPNRAPGSVNLTQTHRRFNNENDGMHSSGHGQRLHSNDLPRNSDSSQNHRRLYDDTFLLYTDSRGRIRNAPRDYEHSQPTLPNSSNQNTAIRTSGSSGLNITGSQAVHKEADRGQDPSERQSGRMRTNNDSYNRMERRNEGTFTGASTSRGSSSIQSHGNENADDEIIVPGVDEIGRNKYCFFYGAVDYYIPWCATCDLQFQTPAALRRHLASREHVKRSLEYRIEHLQAMCQERKDQNVKLTEKRFQIGKQWKDEQDAITQARQSGSKMDCAVIRGTKSGETSTAYTDELFMTNVETRNIKSDNKAMLSTNDNVRQKACTSSVPDLITFASDDENTETSYRFIGAADGQSGLHDDGRKIQKEPHAIDILLEMEGDIPCQHNLTTGDNDNEMNIGSSTSLYPIFQLGSSNDNENIIRCNENVNERNDDILSEEGLLLFDSDEDNYSSASA